MIVGHGDIASVLGPFDRDGVIYFASGVSNSGETRESEYDRERQLLRAQDRSQRLVYFSSLSIFYATNRYARHKVQMEHLVRSFFPSYTIVRIGNIAWGDNPHTLINYLRAHPEAEIQDVDRYIVDLSEFRHWMALTPGFNCEVNIPGLRMKVQDVVDEFVRVPCPI